ncbi:MAG: HD domain-containing protein [Bdellovibrionales bacterium]|nr:HD domain-containing protein [Bdellovibrionales bacterium]
MTTQKIFVKDLKDKDAFETVFLVKEIVELTDKKGNPYLSLTLSDVTGSIDGRIWDNVKALSRQFQQGHLALVKGHVQNYQNRLQVVIHSLKETEDVNYEDFIATSRRPPQENFEEIEKIVETLDDQEIRQVLELTLADKEIRKMLLMAPAAKSIHHAYVGGLVEHVLSICQIMNFFSSHYDFLNRNYLIFGAIYHDLGKIWELTSGHNIQYTDRGRLIGHMQIACEILDEKAGTILGFSSEKKDLLKHIILSHHTKLEYGSPKRPKFLEALLVGLVDELDSRMNCLEGFMSEELTNGQNWTRYSPMFDRYFFLKLLGEKKGHENY